MTSAPGGASGSKVINGVTTNGRAGGTVTFDNSGNCSYNCDAGGGGGAGAAGSGLNAGTGATSTVTGFKYGGGGAGRNNNGNGTADSNAGNSAHCDADANSGGGGADCGSRAGAGGSGYVYIRYLPGPTLTAPSAQTIERGQSATFSVAATKASNLTSATFAYQWQKSANSGSTWSDISGATSASYSTGTQSDLTNSGATYRAKVTQTATSGATSFSYSTAAVLTVTKQAQTISFSALSTKSYGDAAFTLSATASSALAVSFSSATTGVCTVSGSTVTLVSSGTCTINANQAGDANYLAATQVQQSFTVSQATNTITFTQLADRLVSAGSFAVSATAASGLTTTITSATTGVCTVASNQVTILTTGTCTLKANQAGNNNYAAAAEVSNSFTVNPVVVTFSSNFGTPTTATQNMTSASGLTLTANSMTRPGYSFSNWNTISDGSGVSYSDGASATFAAATTLYAQWTPLPNKTVVFNANGGSGSMSNQVTNVATNLTTNAFTRNGYSFTGWATAADGSGTTYTDGASYAFSSNATLYAQWSALPNKTVTFNNNSGSGTMTAQVTNVATNLTANTFTRSGYSFSGWNTAANGSGTAYANQASYAFTADTTLYAQWTALPNKTVTFDANNGSGTMAAQATNVAANLTVNTFTRSGYTFAGWNTAANGTGTSYADAASYAFTADTTLYAQWAAVNYGITYNAPSVTSGAVPTDSANYNIGRSVAILGNSGNLVRTGYTFAGWTVASDGSGTVLVSGSTLTFGAGAINVYAKWTANTYTISYNVNGATGAQANTSDSYTTGGSAVTLSAVGTMQKAGHTFNGWAITASGTPISGSYTTTSDVTLYAQWTINTITVTYDKGTASSATFTFPSGPDSANYGTRLNLSNNVASSVVVNGTYYAFVGWSDGNTTYATGTSYLLSSNVTMTAIWVQAYEVRYSFNGGTAANGTSEVDAECTVVNGSALLCTNGQSITLNAAPSRAGYNFAGWRDQSGTDIAAGTSHSLTLTSYLFYAQWTPISYTVTYSPNGGSSTPTESSKNIGDRFTLANGITRTGYTFNGWSDGSTTYGAGATYVVGSSNIALTAQWTPLVYTINYDWNGGSGSALADASYTVGTTGIILPGVTDQVKDGYTFGGWASTIGGLALSTPFVPTASTTLYAIWGSGSYNITYAPELGTVATTTVTVANGNSINLETPTRQGFVFDGWFTAQTGGTRVGGGNSQFTPAASRTLHARWTQASIYGIPVGNLNRLGSINASGSANSTYSGSNANSSVSVNVPSGALPNGTAVNIDMIGDTAHAGGLINGDKSFILSVAVSWLASDGTVPDTASGKAISVTLNNSGIKAGALIYSIQGTSVVLLGTATQDGTVTFELTQDPGIYVVATSPTAPQNATSTTTSNSATISWLAPSSDGGDAITGYTVTLNSGAICTTTGALSCTINSLTAGTTYTYTVTASNSVGTSPTVSGNFSIAANQTVMFDNNGGSGGMSNQVANASGSLTLNTFSRTGYSFGGWNTAANGSGTAYADGATYAFTAGTTLYAQWAASTYTVTYDYNGATTQNGPSSSGFTSGGSAITLPTPVKIGYSFDGWFTDAGLTTLLGAGGSSYSPTSSPTLYAGWTALPNQTVIFDANGGTGTMSNQVTNVATALTANAFTQPGYNFAGWNTAANGSGTAYANGATYAFTAGATLYAQWTFIPVAPPVVTPPAPIYERPDAPSNVTATAGSDSITVSWSAPAFNGGTPIIDYRVTSSTGMACVTTGTSCTFNGVNKDVSYTFTVTSNNGYRVSNSSSASNTILIPSELINQRALSASGSQSARGAAVKIVVTGGSTNGPIIYDVSNGSATGCSIDGDGWLTATTSGTCLVTVTMLGDFTYKPISANTTVSFLCKLIAQAPLTVNAAGSTSVSLSTSGGSGSGSVSYSVTDGTADCVLAGNTITATKTGTCVVTATKAADDVYEASTSVSITVSVTVAKPVVGTPAPVIKVAPTEHVVAVAPSGKPVLVGTPLIKPIIFGPDSAKLDAGDLKHLRAAATLAKSKNMDVLITGFVKSAGATTLIEKVLASSRARAVATYLRKLGMKVSIAYAGYGAYNKVTPTANDRRVEIRWIAKD